MATKAVILDVGGVLARDRTSLVGDVCLVPQTPANTWRDMEQRDWELFRLFEGPEAFAQALRSRGLLES